MRVSDIAMLKVMKRLLLLWEVMQKVTVLILVMLMQVMLKVYTLKLIMMENMQKEDTIRATLV